MAKPPHDDDRIAAFALSEPVPDVAYDPDAIVEALEDFRRALWRENIRSVPKNLLDWPQNIYSEYRKLLRLQPSRKMNYSEFCTDAVKLLIEINSLPEMVNIRHTPITSTEKLVEYLNYLTDQYLVDPFEEALDGVLRQFCKTDAEREKFLEKALKNIGYRNISIKFNQESAKEPVPGEQGASKKLPDNFTSKKISWKENKALFADPYDFLQKIYPEEIGPDLSWPRVLNLDSGLYHALKRHAGRGKLPEGVNILDRKEVTDRKYATLDPNQVRAAVNLASAVGKRKWRANRNP